MKHLPLALSLLCFACNGSDPPPQTPVSAVTPPPSASPSVASNAPATPVALPAPTATGSAPAPAAQPVTSNADAGGAPVDDGTDDSSAPGRLSTPSGARPAVIVRQGDMMINGLMSREAVQRVVRQNLGRFRLCYETRSKGTPKLEGHVRVKFTISKLGAVSKAAADDGSDLPDKGVVACVVQAFSHLTFPAPNGTDVDVLYPLSFTPGS
jgi:hypothetical protein